MYVFTFPSLLFSFLSFSKDRCLPHNWRFLVSSITLYFFSALLSFSLSLYTHREKRAFHSTKKRQKDIQCVRFLSENVGLTVNDEETANLFSWKLLSNSHWLSTFKFYDCSQEFFSIFFSFLIKTIFFMIRILVSEDSRIR